MVGRDVPAGAPSLARRRSHRACLASVLSLAVFAFVSGCGNADRGLGADRAGQDGGTSQAPAQSRPLPGRSLSVQRTPPRPQLMQTAPMDLDASDTTTKSRSSPPVTSPPDQRRSNPGRM